MPRSEAQKRADKKYERKRMQSGIIKQLQVKIASADYNMIDAYCKNNNVSKAKFVVGACKYCIDNNIDLSSATASSESDTTQTN